MGLCIGKWFHGDKNFQKKSLGEEQGGGMLFLVNASSWQELFSSLELTHYMNKMDT